MVEAFGGIVKELSPLCMKMSEDRSSHLLDGDNFFSRFQRIKKNAPEWLKSLGKNSFGHSLRLERYLDALMCNDTVINLISPAEAFVLLCSVYLHDIGYWLDGKRITENHPQRSHDMILANPSNYLLGDFPTTKGRSPRSPRAIAWVCLGHSEEQFCPLDTIPYEFADAALSDDATLDLRKLSALMRLVDEADDAYVRLSGTDDDSIRADIPLVTIEGNTIIWHWDKGEMLNSARVEQLLQEKKKNLVTSIDYLYQMGFPKWYLVLDPQIGDQPPPFMPPTPVKTFVGRVEDLKILHEKIQKNRKGAITGLAGTGGIGKTELALVYARDYSAEYPDGVFWASLKGSDWRSEAAKIHRVIKPEEEPPIFPDDIMAKHAVEDLLSGKNALLIIDNVSETDEIVVPDCFVLATTRNKTTFGMILPEAVHDLPGLSEEEGKDLMRRVLGPLRVEKDENSANQIVRILGGMPLALEIAVHQLYDALDISFPDYIGLVKGKIQELKIPNNEDKDVEASLMLSLEQLEGTKNGQELIDLFKAASICAESGFDSQALWATAGLQESGRKAAAELVGTLYRRSLLIYDEASSRYSMHPLLRQLSELIARKDKDNEKKFQKNHLGYFLAYVKGHDLDPQNLVAEKDNIWQALIHAGRLEERSQRTELIDRLAVPYWKHISQKMHESAFQYIMAVKLIRISDLGESKLLVTLLEPLTKEEVKIEPKSKGWVLNSMGLAYADLGEYHRAIELYEQALVIHRRIPDARGERADLGNMGSAYNALGENHRAIELYEQALVIDRSIGDVRDEGVGLGNIGVAYAGLGEYRRAIELYEQALEIARGVGDVWREGTSLVNMGSAYAELGEHRRAIELFEQVLVIARSVGDVRGEGAALGNMGLAYMQFGEYRRAFELFEQTLVIHRHIGDVRGEGKTLLLIGLAYFHLSEYCRAIELYEQALAIHQRIGDVRSEGKAFSDMGLAYFHLRQYDRAIELFEQALVIDRHIGDVRGEGDDLGNMGSVYTCLGEYRRAIELYEQALLIDRRVGDVHGEGKALGNMGLAYVHLGEYRRAIELCEQALVIHRRFGDVHGEGRALSNMSLAYFHLGEYRRAAELREQAQQSTAVLELREARALPPGMCARRIILVA